MRYLSALALSAAALFAVASTAAAQAPKLDATGVYNCSISAMHRCLKGKCETRTPPAGMEMSINFDTKSACVRRKGDCRRPRTFSVAERGTSYILIFAQHGMVFRLRPNGHLTVSDLSSRGAVNVEAMCARG